MLFQAPLDHIPLVIGCGAQVAIIGNKSQASYGKVHLVELENVLFGKLVKGYLALVGVHECRDCEKAENCTRRHAQRMPKECPKNAQRMPKECPKNAEVKEVDSWRAITLIFYMSNLRVAANRRQAVI